MNKILAIFFFLSFSLIGYSQETDIKKTAENAALNDSLLEANTNESEKLLVVQDSVKIADSIQQEKLQEEIAALKENDQNSKKRLQAKLDSLKKVQEERKNSIQKQVDSLRASTVGVPVILFTDTLFYVYFKFGPFSPKERAVTIQNKLEKIVDSEDYTTDNFIISSSVESEDVFYENLTIYSISDRDAIWMNTTRKELAKEYLNKIKESITAYQEENSIIQLIKRIILLLITLLGFYFGIRFLNKWLTSLNIKMLKRLDPFIHGVKFRNYEFLSADRETQFLSFTFNLLKWVVIVIILYLLLPVIFSIFPATKGIATTLIGYILNPVKNIVHALIGYIPEFITILVIVFITHYVVKFLKFLANEVQSEKLILPGFYPDWAKPTLNLLKIIIYAFSFVVIFPYLPGSDSAIFQGVSVFLGLLISLGSSSAISNITAGLVITYMRAFKIGDRVKIGDITGDVVGKNMLVTRVRTIKNEDISIPNSAIMNGSTINYSSSAVDLGLILNTKVTIGYDVPWTQVHELLLAAAKKTEHIDEKPSPFVLQTALNDFYVEYQINAYTKNVRQSALIYSHLHENIQDAFNEAGVEIMSPHYRAERDGNTVTIPAQYLPKDYKSSGFNVNLNKSEDQSKKP